VNFREHAGIDEEILPPQSNRTSQAPSWRLGNVEFEELTDQTTVEEKLSPKPYGPFKILEMKGSLASKLETSPRWKIHTLVQVSLLKPYRASNQPNRE